MGRLRLIRALEDDGLYDHANEACRRVCRRPGLELDVRSLEEAAEAFNAALKEMLGGGQLGEKRLRLFRFLGLGETGSMAKSGVLAHNRGQGHLPFTFRRIKHHKNRAAVLSLGLTGNVIERLAVVSYRSPAFSAPGRRPAHLEAWRGTKSWEAMGECEVRPQTPVSAVGLDLKIHHKNPIDGKKKPAPQKLCGRHRVITPASWPPDL